MREQAYYLNYDLDEDNACRTDKNLIVNCCGITNMINPFETIRLKGREDFYIQYIISGKLDFKIDGKYKTVSSGEAIIHFPHSPCVYKNYRQEPVQYYWVHFTGAKVKEFVESCDFSNQEIISIGDHVASIISSFEKLFLEFSTRDKCFHFIVAALLVTIVTKITRNKTDLKKSTGKRTLRHAISYIHTHYQKKDIPIEYLAKLEHLSASRFRTIFKENMDISPKDYILNHKINHAKQLLGRGTHSVKEVAFEIGYTDQLYFSRMFRKKTGYSPMQYKMQSLK